eukprot:scaffold106134_cov44-Prasinocladus_malaysianus.AAC.2
MATALSSATATNDAALMIITGHSGVITSTPPTWGPSTLSLPMFANSSRLRPGGHNMLFHADLNDMHMEDECGMMHDLSFYLPELCVKDNIASENTFYNGMRRAAGMQ